MANDDQIKQLRGFINEPESVVPYSDNELSAAIDQAGSPQAAAYSIWISKAAEYSDMVNMSEGGSTRSFSDLHKQALSMADVFKPYVASIPDPVARSSRTRAIVRP